MKYILLLVLSVFILPAQAGMISSQQAFHQEAASLDKQKLLNSFNSAQVQSKLTSLGVDSELAQARIDSLTPSEIAQLNTEMENMPAGGIVGTVVTVAIVLVVLDLLGVTDLFDFIDPV